MRINRIKLALALIYSTTAMSAGAAELVSAGAEPELVADTFIFTEGPAADEDGNLYFSDIPNNRIHIWSTDGELSVFRENTNATNGLFFDNDWQLYGCEGGAGRIVRMDENGQATPVAEEYNGEPFNSPNDLWIDAEGGIYFTDPRYGDESDLPQDGYHVYYLAREGGEVERIISDLERPNGIIGTRDGSTLYVADHGAGETYVYTITSPGQVSDKRLFADQGSDGVTLDEQGNLYLTGQAVTVFNPQGELIETIELPQAPANVAFAGPERNILTITARDSLYSLQMDVRGMY